MLLPHKICETPPAGLTSLNSEMLDRRRLPGKRNDLVEIDIIVLVDQLEPCVIRIGVEWVETLVAGKLDCGEMCDGNIGVCSGFQLIVSLVRRN